MLRLISLKNIHWLENLILISFPLVISCLFTTFPNFFLLFSWQWRFLCSNVRSLFQDDLWINSRVRIHWKDRWQLIEFTRNLILLVPRSIPHHGTNRRMIDRKCQIYALKFLVPILWILISRIFNHLSIL